MVDKCVATNEFAFKFRFKLKYAYNFFLFFLISVMKFKRVFINDSFFVIISLLSL